MQGQLESWSITDIQRKQMNAEGLTHEAGENPGIRNHEDQEVGTRMKCHMPAGSSTQHVTGDQGMQSKAHSRVESLGKMAPSSEVLWSK